MKLSFFRVIIFAMVLLSGMIIGCSYFKSANDNPSDIVVENEKFQERGDLIFKARDDLFIKNIREKINGKEELPAKDVFENIQVESLKDISADNLLKTMDWIYTTQLGVDCLHCHVENDWANDSKKPKDIARGMQVMLSEMVINNNSIFDIKEITGNEDAYFNCNTCHGFTTKPNEFLQRVKRIF